MTIPNKEHRKRVYYWKTRHALEKYFEVYYGMTRGDVGVEIDEARRGFRVRRYRVIDMRDLWQRTGLAIIKRCPQVHPYYCTCPVVCVHMCESICSWHKDCPWRSEIVG
jgi:hypothetical protein